MQSEIFQTVSLILNLVLGGGFIVTIFTIKAERKKRNADAELAQSNVKLSEIDIDIKNEEFHDARFIKFRDTINAQDKLISELRQRIIDIEQTQLNIKLELIKEQDRRRIAEYNVCNVAICCNRNPPKFGQNLDDGEPKPKIKNLGAEM